MKEITMDDYQFLDSFKKKRIQLTLRTAAYAGTVHRINLNNKSVLLGDVVDVKSGRKFAGMKLFFGHEILNVELPHAPKPEQGNKEDHSRSTEGQLPVEFQPYRKNIKLDDDEDDGEYVDFVVIDEFFEKFGPAVMDIRKQQVIGIGADGVGVSQHERLCWLQIASKTRVYLFDILLLGARAFKNGLSMILESGHILKVTHDCRGIARCLWTQYGVNLCNVFDTQVADVMSFHAETGGFLPDRVSTVQEVLALHLKMSPACLASLKVKSQLTKEDSEVWYVRPCPVSLLKVMALSVIHLQPLRMVLLDALMADYTGRVDCCLSVSREEPVNTQSIGTSSGLELPAQLRELESLHRQRRQWASARYPVTQGGLLIRSRPRPGELPHRTSGSWGADLPMEAERSAPGEAGQGPGESGQWGPQASGEGPGGAGEGPGEAGQWGPQVSGEGPGEAGQWGLQASGEGPGEAGQWGLQASGEGPGELSRSRPSLGLSSWAGGRPSGSPEVTQIPGKAPSGEAPVPTAGRDRPLEIAGPGAEEGTAGRGRLPQREGAPSAATFPLQEEACVFRYRRPSPGSFLGPQG